MKTLIVLFLAGFSMFSDFNHDDMIEYSGVIKYSDTSEVTNLEIGKTNYMTSSGMTEEVKISAKGIESTVKIDHSKEFELIIRSNYKDKKEGLKISILKFEIEKDKRIAKSVFSQFKAEKNKSMDFVSFSSADLDADKGIFKVKINSKLEQGNYGIVFGSNNGKSIPVGYISTKTTLFFDVI
jgi:hypothetical protein